MPQLPPSLAKLMPPPSEGRLFVRLMPRTPHPPRSSAPSPREKAHLNRAFGQQTKVHFVTVTTLDRRGRRSLQSGRMTDGCAVMTHMPSGRRGRRPLPARCMSFVSATDESAICNRYDLGRPMVAPTGEIEILTLTTNQTKISMSFFTIKIKKKHAVACCPRVSSSLLNLNSEREYRYRSQYPKSP